MELGEDLEYLVPSVATNGSSTTSRTRGPRDGNESMEARKRPKLTHTKSDTNIHRRNPFRGDSPPLPLAPDGKAPAPPLSCAVSSPSSRSRDSSCGETNNGQKRHISFNTFVEQCIAIEKPETPGDGYFIQEDDDFDITDEMDEYRDYEEESDNEEYASEDEVLEMRPGLHSRTYTRRAPSLPGMPSSHGFDMSNTGLEREHVTIAPIAPTMLKTSASPSPVGAAFYQGGYGSVWEEEEGEALFASKRSHTASAYSGADRSDSVTLVYVPPQGSVYADRRPGNGMSADWYTTGAGGGVRAHGKPLGSPPPPTQTQLRSESFDDAELLASPRHAEDELDPPLESGFDLFTGSDMGGGVEDSLYRSGVMPRSGRSPGQARSASTSDLASRIVSDVVSAQTEDSHIGRSKGSSSSVSEDGTVMPPSVALPSSPRTVLKAQREAAAPSPVPVSSPLVSPHPSPNLSASIPIPNHGHVHQSPSPAPSAASTGTSSTTSGGSGYSVGSYGSPFLEPPSRGRSISPNTSPSASGGDSVRGRSTRQGSSTSLSDVDYSGRDKGDREPQRGRSRSRSIGTVDGSVSPRSGSHSRLSRRASIDCGGIGLGGLGVSYGLSASPTWRGQSLSPEEEDGTRKGGKAKLRVRNDKGGESSVSPPSNGRGEKIVVVVDDNPITVPRNITDCPESSEGDTVHHIIVEDTDAPSNIPTSSSPSLAPLDTLLDSASTTPTATNAPTPPISIRISNSAEESATLVGRAVSSAKGYLGALWGTQGGSDASNALDPNDR